MNNLQESVKEFPLSPGVYIWRDKNNKPLYVGRATSLRRRVLQYFRKDIDPRIGEMVSLASKVEHHQTASVLEAIILEANLIKKYWPKYNVKDKDNRSFIYIVFAKTDFPKPIIVRGRELESFPKSSARIFGPYQSLTLVRNALKIIRRIFPYSTCLPTGKACFEHQVGLCPGVCVGAISKQDYQKNINNIILLLKGEKNRLLKKLTKENPAAALALKHFQDVTLISREEFEAGEQKFNRIEGYDISHFAGKEVYGSMVVFTNGQPDKSQYRLFKIKTVTNNDLDALKEMMERRLKHTEWPTPDLILIDGGKPQIDYLSKTMVDFQVKFPFLGLSKLNGDHLVYPSGTKNVFKDLALTIKRTLQAVRDEAHRFANRGRSRRYNLDNFGR
ncbi:MAG TPA: GIY-YIG nuclease family protein [Candidatus Udaeobacter sp.]|nr:GIY-YIG nuclease family protein [Candidatus Udaeobacter sp.]